MAAIDDLITEVKTDYQIPSFISDDSIRRYAEEGIAYFQSLVVGTVDYETDKQLRGLLKNYIYYAYEHVTNEFRDNFKPMILSWQWEHEEPKTDIEGGDDDA